MIIHYAHGASPDYMDVTYRCLMKAEDIMCVSVALPAFGTGMYISMINVIYIRKSYYHL